MFVKKTQSTKALQEFLSKNQIREDVQTLSTYGKDWLKHFPSQPSLVLFPKTSKEVKKIVLWARENKKKLIPSGGRTGLSGGATALNGEVIVSFDQMNQILNFNSIRETITCEPGVVTEKIQNYVEERGFFFPIHFSAQGSSQIGGNIATNAGGIKVIHYGLMRRWVQSLKVITGQGELLTLGKPLIKNATGYDLMQLFIGSEGTLGFIVEATLKFLKKTQKTKLLFLSFKNLSALLPIYEIMKEHFKLHSFEFITDLALKNVLTLHPSLKHPFSAKAPFYLLIEVDSQTLKRDEDFFKVYEKMEEKNLINDAILSQSSTQTKELWALRENISEALSPYTPYKNDISVPVDHIPKLIEKLEALIHKHYPEFEVIWFGHVGDGNLHINILKPPSMPLKDFLNHCKKVDPLIFELIETLDGSISAEHGIGLLKKPHLHFSKSLLEIEIMKKIKDIFDPDQIMNPGKIFD